MSRRREEAGFPVAAAYDDEALTELRCTVVDCVEYPMHRMVAERLELGEDYVEQRSGGLVVP